MKSVTLVACLMLGACSAINAADPAPTTQPTAAAPVNKKCPVGGDDVDPKVTVIYDGKVIGFCCKDCIAEFQKDPEKYMKKLQ